MNLLCSLFIATLIGVVIAKKLPSYLQPCPKSEKEAGPCIIKNVKILQPKMEKGIPELLIPALNPLILSKANLETDKIRAVFKDSKLYNLHMFELKKLTLDLGTLDVDIAINFPAIYTNAEYSLNGKILVLEINSKGRAEGNFTDLSAEFKGKMELYDKNGKKHLKIAKTDIDLTIKNASMYFSDLFPNNEELTINANKVLNENALEVIKDFMPVLTEVIKSIVIGITNNIFQKFSFDELFP
ncbi:unnamed protein product [Psylliodes chrysocephalus]|uniref:Uncharacterized protein n=1 Tax=Psylliodes chrysocephalus TaxID=3402493 RepID=A0A9P0G6H4_9CUCU|nr:unnamed protein product [Psylliodes chrysocephala]